MGRGHGGTRSGGAKVVSMGAVKFTMEQEFAQSDAISRMSYSEAKSRLDEIERNTSVGGLNIDEQMEKYIRRWEVGTGKSTPKDIANRQYKITQKMIEKHGEKLMSERWDLIDRVKDLTTIGRR